MADSELRLALQRYHPESFGWAMCCCRRDPAQAEEVLQITYLKVLEGKARFDGKSAFKTWLFAVIRQTAADQRRRAIFRRMLPWHWLARRAAPPQPDAALHQAELQAIFQRSLARLSRRQREVLQLVFYHDLSLSQAAEVMGTSVGSARRHYERGKSALRRLLQERRPSHEPGPGTVAGVV